LAGKDRHSEKCLITSSVFAKEINPKTKHSKKLKISTKYFSTPVSIGLINDLMAKKKPVPAAKRADRFKNISNKYGAALWEYAAKRTTDAKAKPYKRMLRINIHNDRLA